VKKSIKKFMIFRVIIILLFWNFFRQ